MVAKLGRDLNGMYGYTPKMHMHTLTGVYVRRIYDCFGHVSDNVTCEYCPSLDNLADCPTNALPRAALEHQRLAMGLGPVLNCMCLCFFTI